MNPTRYVLWFLLFTPSLLAHPVPENSYDRSITVRLTARAVEVEYILEVDSYTARNDVPSLVSKKELAGITRADEVHDAFARASAPLLAHNLLAKLDGKTLLFTLVKRQHKVLDHLRCEYRFEATWTVQPGKEHVFTFRETNYDEELGAVRLSLEAAPDLTVRQSTQPDEALKKRLPIDLRPGDHARLRSASATFHVAGAPPPKQESDLPRTDKPPLKKADAETLPPNDVKVETSDAEAEEPTRVTQGRQNLHDLLFASDLGWFAVLAVAAFLGAVHALTPGHGKTLVAAYLVGQRGTMGHAVLLGLVTAITHTGAVLLVAGLLPIFFPDVKTSTMQRSLGFIGGFLIAALGFWLLQRRLAGKADHFHIGGGHHHHHHHDGHDHHDHPPGEPVSIKSLVVLGISGGIVPCGEALALFLLAIRWQRLELAFWLLVAFSVGLAIVLVAIGIGVVFAQRFASGHLHSDRFQNLSRTLTLLSALFIFVLGIWLCYDSMHADTP